MENESTPFLSLVYSTRCSSSSDWKKETRRFECEHLATIRAIFNLRRILFSLSLAFSVTIFNRTLVSRCHALILTFERIYIFSRQYRHMSTEREERDKLFDEAFFSSLWQTLIDVEEKKTTIRTTTTDNHELWNEFSYKLPDVVWLNEATQRWSSS